LLVTAAEGLFDIYLDGISAGRRQNYRCGCCRRFVESYGTLVRVGVDGRLTTVLWEPEDVPSLFSNAVAAVRRQVVASPVSGVFISGDAVWGNPTTGSWAHLHGYNPAVFQHLLMTPYQMTAEKAEDYKPLRRGLAEFHHEIVKQAVRLLDADALYRREKTRGVARWLHGRHDALAPLSGDRKDNAIWKAVASAPPGFCHVRSTMIGTLLEDPAGGMSF